MRKILKNLKKEAKKIWENYWEGIVGPYSEAMMHGGSCGFV
jgi:hypothetical protein